MRTFLGGLLAAGLIAVAAGDARAQGVAFGFSAYPSGYYGPYPGYYAGYMPVASYPGYFGAYPGYYTAYAPAAPVYGGPATFPYPAAYGGYGYTYSYYTHVPGYSFTYYRGRTPRYYPSQFGPVSGYYGYGPWGW